MNPEADLIRLRSATLFDTFAREDASLDRVVRIRACNRSSGGVISLGPVLVEDDVSRKNLVNQFNGNREEFGVDIHLAAPRNHAAS